MHRNCCKLCVVYPSSRSSILNLNLLYTEISHGELNLADLQEHKLQETFSQVSTSLTTTRAARSEVLPKIGMAFSPLISFFLVIYLLCLLLSFFFLLIFFSFFSFFLFIIFFPGVRLEPASSYKSNFGWGQYSAQRLTYDNERDKFVNAPGPNLVTIRRQPFAQGMRERRRRGEKG